MSLVKFYFRGQSIMSVYLPFIPRVGEYVDVGGQSLVVDWVGHGVGESEEWETTIRLR